MSWNIKKCQKCLSNIKFWAKEKTICSHVAYIHVCRNNPRDAPKPYRQLSSLNNILDYWFCESIFSVMFEILIRRKWKNLWQFCLRLSMALFIWILSHCSVTEVARHIKFKINSCSTTQDASRAWFDFELSESLSNWIFLSKTFYFSHNYLSHRNRDENQSNEKRKVFIKLKTMSINQVQLKQYQPKLVY